MKAVKPKKVVLPKVSSVPVTPQKSQVKNKAIAKRVSRSAQKASSAKKPKTAVKKARKPSVAPV